MKKTNKCSESKKPISKDNKKELNNNQIFHNRKKEKIIKDLKLKGYNEREITDIFEIFLSNSIDKEISEKVEEEKHQSINLNKNLIVAVNKNVKNKHKKFNYNSTNSRPNLSYKNTLLVKTENSEYKTTNNNNSNKNKSKISYLKVNINSSSEKYRLLKIKEKNEKKYIKSNKRNNIPYNMRDIQRSNNINNEGLTCPTKFISDRNVKIKNNLKKYNSHSGNEIIINTDKKNVVSKKELLKKLGNEMLDLNYKNINYKKMTANRCKIRLNKDKNKNMMKKNQDGTIVNLKNKKIMTSKEKFRTADLKERTHSCSNKKTRTIKSHLNPESKVKDNNNSFTNKEYKRYVKTQINSGTKKIKEIKIPKDILHVTKINDLKNRGIERVISEKKNKEINENEKYNKNININYNENDNDVIYIEVKNRNKRIYNNVDKKEENHKINLIKQIKVNVKENIENKEINQIINSNIQDTDNNKEITYQNQNQNENDVKENIKEIDKETKESTKIRNNYDIDEEKKNDIELDNNKNKNKNSDNENNINDKIKIIKNKNKNNLKSENNSHNSMYDSLNKQMPLSTSRSNNIFIIRKQKNEEDDVMAKKNIAIVEIKVQSRTNSTHNYIANNKSKSLSRQISFDCKNANKSFENNLKRPNSNHTFVNINLCKDKENSSVVYINRGKRHDSSKENSCINFRNKILITNNKDKNNQNNFENKKSNNIKISCMDFSPKNKNYSMGKNINKINKVNSDLNNKNDINNSNNHIIYTSYNLKNRKTEHLNNSNSINSNMISNEEDNDNFNIYVNKIKYFDNGKYEGIMLNNKREIKGVMTYNNGARYEGQWRNDKKNGKGIFISSHYFDCKNKVGMKYEGEFKDDKLDGYGIGIYSNGDKYVGEWKNNKQYGRGTVEYMGGSKYEGEWVNGKFEGIGIFYLKNGERFEGRFSDSKYNGYGKYFYINGDYLEGIFKNDRPTGTCLLHKVDGTITQVVHP